MAKLWLQEEDGGSKSQSFLTQDAGAGAGMWVSGREMLFRGGGSVGIPPLVGFWGLDALSGWKVC